MRNLLRRQCRVTWTSVSETQIGGRDLDRNSLRLTILLTVSVIIAANAMNRRAGPCEAAVGMAEESGSRRPSIPHDYRPQGNDHPTARTPVRAVHCGGSPPGSLPRRPYQAGTAIARVGAPHSHSAQEDPRDLLTPSPGHPHWAANCGIHAIVTAEPRAWKRARVLRTDGRRTRPNSTAVTSLRAAPLVAARPLTGCLERG